MEVKVYRGCIGNIRVLRGRDDRQNSCADKSGS